MKDKTAPPVLSARVLFVAADGANGAYTSISEAAQNASEGDQIMVAAGYYSPSKTGEQFPIYVPPNCSLIGSDAASCILDGEGQTRILVRPLDPSRSLVILGDKATICQMCLQNSGSNALSNETGAAIVISDCILQDNAQHGALVFAPECAVLSNNRFLNNGTAKNSYTPPRPTPGRQGHHIFIESRPNVANRVIIHDNVLDKTYADGIAIDVFDQPASISMWVEVINNKISRCGRNGMSLAASFGPPEANVFLDIRKNQFSHIEGNAIDSQAAFSLIMRRVTGAKLTMNIVGNTIDGVNDGINVFGAFSPGEANVVHVSIINNRISHTRGYGIRVIGCVGMDGWTCHRNTVHCVIAGNELENKTIHATPIFVQGGIARDNETVLENRVFVQIVQNRAGGENGVVINDGLKSNAVILVAGSQAVKRADKPIPYRP